MTTTLISRQGTATLGPPPEWHTHGDEHVGPQDDAQSIESIDLDARAARILATVIAGFADASQSTSTVADQPPLEMISDAPGSTAEDVARPDVDQRLSALSGFRFTAFDPLRFTRATGVFKSGWMAGLSSLRLTPGLAATPWSPQGTLTGTLRPMTSPFIGQATNLARILGPGSTLQPLRQGPGFPRLFEPRSPLFPDLIPGAQPARHRSSEPGVQPRPAAEQRELGLQATVRPAPPSSSAHRRYPNLMRALREGRITGANLPDPSQRTIRTMDMLDTFGESDQVGFGAVGDAPEDHVRRPTRG